jgi:hypothetical protein
MWGCGGEFPETKFGDLEFGFGAGAGAGFLKFEI